MRTFLLLGLAPIVSLSLPMSIVAEEIRILDVKGLVRSMGDVEDTASVRVEVSPHSGYSLERCVLKHLDGVSADISAPLEAGICTLRHVTSGAWELDVRSADGSGSKQSGAILIREVRIEGSAER